MTSWSQDHHSGLDALFALAAAGVSDVSGPLSHGSIVAREYHIPAVLGTGLATEHMASGQTITVDGDAGTVTIANPAPHRETRN